MFKKKRNICVTVLACQLHLWQPHNNFVASILLVLYLIITEAVCDRLYTSMLGCFSLLHKKNEPF